MPDGRSSASCGSRQTTGFQRIAWDRTAGTHGPLAQGAQSRHAQRRHRALGSAVGVGVSLAGGTGGETACWDVQESGRVQHAVPWTAPRALAPPPLRSAPGRVECRPGPPGVELPGHPAPPCGGKLGVGPFSAGRHRGPVPSAHARRWAAGSKVIAPRWTEAADQHQHGRAHPRWGWCSADEASPIRPPSW